MNTKITTKTELTLNNKLATLFNQIESLKGELDQLDIANITKILEKLAEKEGLQFVELLINNHVNQLALLISKMDWVNGSCWLSYFQGKIYGFTKFWKKNYTMKFPNFAFAVKL